MNKEFLQNEIDMIKDEQLRAWTKTSLQQAPDYFFIAPASSTGKYHPACANVEGGLQVHVRRVVYLAEKMCTGLNFSPKERDIVISACILHDIAKLPHYQNYKDYENHPIHALQYFQKDYPENLSPSVGLIQNCVRYHMGPWTPASIRKNVSAYSQLELVVYLSDYVASTKDLVTPVDK